MAILHCLQYHYEISRNDVTKLTEEIRILIRSEDKVLESQTLMGGF